MDPSPAREGKGLGSAKTRANLPQHLFQKQGETRQFSKSDPRKTHFLATRPWQRRALGDKSGKSDEKECSTQGFDKVEFEKTKFGDAGPKMAMQESAKQISQHQLGTAITLSPEGRTLAASYLGESITLSPEGRMLAEDELGDLPTLGAEDRMLAESPDSKDWYSDECDEAGVDGGDEKRHDGARSATSEASDHEICCQLGDEWKQTWNMINIHKGHNNNLDGNHGRRQPVGRKSNGATTDGIQTRVLPNHVVYDHEIEDHVVKRTQKGAPGDET